jgi:predicted DNA-binding ribbon-helix-helix protein
MTANDSRGQRRGQNEQVAATPGVWLGANGKTDHSKTTTRLHNKNITVEEHRTSMRLEPEFWDAIAELCRREKIDLAEMVRGAVLTHPDGGRTSAVRVFVLDYFRSATFRRA